MNNIRLYKVDGNVPVALATSNVSLSDDKKEITVKGVSFASATEYKIVIKSLADSKAQLSAEKSFAFKTSATAIINQVAGIAAGTAVNLSSTSADIVVSISNGTLDGATVNANTVVLTEVSKGTRVAASVSGSGTTITIDLLENLTNEKQYKLSINGVKTVKTDAVEAYEAVLNVNAPTPAVAANYPQVVNGTQTVSGTQWGKITAGTNGSTYIPGFQLTAVFSTKLDESTIAANYVLVDTAADTVVPTTFTYNADSKTVVLKPVADLKENTAYAVKVKDGLKSSLGIAASAATVANFTTLDLTSPTVVSLTSKDGDNALKVGDAHEFTVTFSETVAGNTLAAGNIVLVKTSVDLSAITNSDLVAISTPTLVLGSDKTYKFTVAENALERNQAYKLVVIGKDNDDSASVTTAIADNGNNSANNKLATSSIISFSTEGADVTGPAFSKVYSGSDLTDATKVVTTKANVEASSVFTFVFDSALGTSQASGVDTTKVSFEKYNGSSWTAVTGNNTALTLSRQSNGTDLTGLKVTLGSATLEDATYRITVDAGAVQDSFGNKNTDKTVFTFIGTAGDDRKEDVTVATATISGTTLTSADTAGSRIYVQFVETDLPEVTAANIVVTKGGTAVAGTVSKLTGLTGAGLTGTAYEFKPNANLTLDATYVVTVKDVKDLAGNTIGTKVFSFVTASDVAKVVSVSVADGDQNVDRQKQIAITLSKDYDLTTAGAVTLNGSAANVIGSGKAYKVQFSELSPNTAQTLVINLPGTENDKTINFVTGTASTDDFAPIVSTVSAIGATATTVRNASAGFGTAIDKITDNTTSITIAYSQNINKDNAVVTIYNVTDGKVVDVISTSVSTNTLTINPVLALAHGNTYKITVSGVTDGNGNTADALTFYIN